MAQNETDALTDLLPPLLRAYEVLFFVSRHFHPPQLEQVLSAIGTPDKDLKEARARCQEWTARMGDLGAVLDRASDDALRAFAGLREVADGGGDIRTAFGALRFVPKGLEALYPLARVLPPVNRFFLDPALRSDAALQSLFLRPPEHDNTGVIHFASEANGGERGSFWLYVPEHYSPGRAWPLVVAMHGGSGTGRQFLWTWLRDARSRGAILAAPTSIGPTWALTGEDIDTPNILRMLEIIRANWNLDSARLLLTGMSDGGTFSYVSGLEPGSPFTHLAPVSAAFHLLLAEMCDPARVTGLPIYIVHGALDWMFPSAMARAAARSLTDAGASVTYREIEDLSHTYPREMNAEILAWMEGRAGSSRIFS